MANVKWGEQYGPAAGSDVITIAHDSTPRENVGALIAAQAAVQAMNDSRSMQPGTSPASTKPQQRTR